MANCRIQNLTHPCGYQLEGVDAIGLVDFEDFEGFKFDGDDLYDNCYVVAVRHRGDLVDVASPEPAKYTSSYQSGIYTHTLETFISDLSAEMVSMLHLATKRRYLVLFRTKGGTYHTFGYEAGAVVVYAGQTSGGTGALVTITATSVYPLFEIDSRAMDLHLLGTEDKKNFITSEDETKLFEIDGYY